jgi:anti-anti-sigma factor
MFIGYDPQNGGFGYTRHTQIKRLQQDIIMEYNTHLQLAQDTYIITLKGEFTFTENKKFREINEEIAKLSVKHFVIDISGLTFIDSAALSMLIVIQEENRKQGRDMVLRSPRGQVREILTKSKFHKFFSIQDDSLQM